MASTPTIHQVAKRAGVSTATVSRVLTRPDVVAPATRKKVLRAIQAMGYTPNSSASTLRTLRTRKLLVTVPDISNPFFSQILQGIEDAALRAGYSVLVGDTQHDEQREEGYARMLKRREADGLIFLGHRLPKEAATIVRAAAPACAPVVNGCEFSPTLGIPGVHIDNARAAAEAMAHLYSLGHRRVGVVTGPLVSPLSRDRLRGAMSQARKAGAERGLVVVQGDFSIESGVAAGERLFKSKDAATAVFCFNDEMAIGVLNAARQRGLTVPRDVSLVGFDDIRFAQYSEPPLTTVAQPMREIGERLVRLILDILEGGVTNPASITLPHRLVLRATTAPVRTRGRLLAAQGRLKPAPTTDTMPTMPVAAGTQLGPYEVVSVLGAGGMGEVYCAVDTRLNRRVALKVLPTGSILDTDRLQRFEQEARAASALNHPNIVTIYDVGGTGALRYMAMELIEGSTLRSLIVHALLPLPQALQIAAQIARALAKAHDAGIVHRDLKPENVMVTRDGYVKLLDFGLAKRQPPADPDAQTGVVTTPELSTTPGLVLGTVGYMSPEQCRGVAADFRTDQFSLGAIIHEMVSGERAFTGDSPVEVLTAIMRDMPPALSSLRPVPRSLDAIVLKCLAKEAARRYESTRELSQSLDDALREAAVPLSSATGAIDLPRAERRSTPGPSIAVLAFSDMSPGRDQEYFCDGIADELISYLGALEGVRVASRIAAFQFKNQQIDVAEIGRRLNVATILAGSVRKAGNRLRITVQLTDVRNGFQLWSERYDRDLDDVFAIQDEIARGIVDKMRGQLAGGSISDILDQRSKRRTDDPDAYQAYLRGRFFWNQRTPASLQQAIGHFQKAVEHDPGYGLAYTGLSDSLNLLGYYNVLPPVEAYPKAKSASGQALQIDAGLAEAHASRGFSQLMFDRDWATSEQSMRRAIELDPTYASAHQWLAWVLLAQGRFEEALRSVRTAAELDPLSPVIGCHHAYALELLGRRAEAVEQLKTTLMLNPSFGLAHFHLGCLRLADGHSEDAVQSLRAAVDASGGRIGLGYLGQAFGVAGRTDEARAVLARLQSDARAQYTSPLDFALVHAGLGESDQVFVRLNQALNERVSDMIRVTLLPWPAAVRSDPRFDAIQRAAASSS